MGTPEVDWGNSGGEKGGALVLAQGNLNDDRRESMRRIRGASGRGHVTPQTVGQKDEGWLCWREPVGFNISCSWALAGILMETSYGGGTRILPKCGHFSTRLGCVHQNMGHSWSWLSCKFIVCAHDSRAFCPPHNTQLSLFNITLEKDPAFWWRALPWQCFLAQDGAIGRSSPLNTEGSFHFFSKYLSSSYVPGAGLGADLWHGSVPVLLETLL